MKTFNTSISTETVHQKLSQSLIKDKISKLLLLAGCCIFLASCGHSAVEDTFSDKNTSNNSIAESDSDSSENTTTAASDKVNPVASDSNYDDIFNHEIVSTTENAPAYFIIDGHEFKVNSSAFCTYFEGIGPAVVVGDQLQYRIKIQDKSYAEVKVGDITAKAVAAGATILEGPSTSNSDGHEYIYFVYSMSGDKCIGFSLEGPDSDRAIGVQIALIDNTVPVQDAIDMAMQVATTATLTSSPDSTKEDIDKQYNNMNYSSGKRVDQATISFESASLTFTVPEGYNQTFDQVDEYSALQFYKSGDTSVDLALRPLNTFGDTTNYLKNMLMWVADEDAINSITTVTTEKGELAYVSYYNESYESYFISCALIVSNNYILSLEAENEARALNLNDVIGFFDCKEKEIEEEIVIGPATVIKHDQLFQGSVDNIEHANELIAQYGEIQRSKYDNSKINDIERSLQSKYDICAVNLGELDIKTAKDVERGVTCMFEKYPALKGSLNTLSLANMTGASTTYVALTQTVDFIVVDEATERPRVIRNEIILNANKWLNRDNMLAMCKENVESGYWFDNASDPSKIIVHELAHQLLNVIRAKEYGFFEKVNGSTVYMPCLLTEQNKEAYINYYWAGTALNQEIEKDLMKEAYKNWQTLGHSGTEEDFRCSISQYANGLKSDGGISYHETFAEAVADVYCNGDNAADASKCIVELAEKKLSK